MTIKIYLKIIQTNRAWDIHYSIRKPNGILQTIVLTFLEHRQTIHQLPNWTSHYTIIICLSKEVNLCLLIFQDNSIEPIVGNCIWRIYEEPDIWYILEVLLIFSSDLTLACNILVYILQLSTSHCSIDVWHTIVEANMVMAELPAMWNLRLGSNMLGISCQLLIIEEHHTAATSSDGLVTIEANRTNLTKCTSMLSFECRTNTLCCILYKFDMPLFTDSCNLINTDRMTE